MTVAELIEALKEFPGELMVLSEGELGPNAIEGYVKAFRVELNPMFEGMTPIVYQESSAPDAPLAVVLP